MSMSSVLLTCKSGNDWTQADLQRFAIRVTDIPFEGFFSPLSLSDLPPLPHSLEPFASIPHHTQAPDDATYKWLHYLDLAQDDPEEIAVDVFADRLLHLIGYDQGRRLILTRHAIPSVFCGIQYSLTTDVCICDENETILLLAKDDKSHVRRGLGDHGIHGVICGDAFPGASGRAITGRGEAEATLIASAIAAFRSNNDTRLNKLGLPQLEEMSFPGISFTGTLPTFYRIRVTAKLQQAVETGTHADSVTEVLRHVPKVPGSRDKGMKDLANRQTLLRYFVAFKRFLL
ncbi:hypothetical protein D9756_007518 [Leucocoprinus leucothites]|uniref:Uncharacterized protein n=1 Tax=Leucocoprinus leucothites TaxID=201217 RepID=A0A8H5D125_9AGAR|nr:hypothetical protein D9756_007518 [Leucoagaricus leucothites]